MKIRKLLIANRGEIACRVMDTARQLGIRTVAVYSDADRDALHVRRADEAVNIGAPAPAESYLVIEKIITAAKETGSDAIHPGYGFLSENADFANACESAGITFVGPSTHAIDLMGDKAKSKRAMIEAGVPCIPGYQGEDQDTATLSAEGGRLGYPLMIKAAAGGGGRGMRLIHSDAGMEDAIDAARSEAINAFGSGDLILEKAVIRPRHVEVQVFGDSHGNIIYLGERDCSVQRRHQKVIEEAPCPVMTPELRAQMGEAAVAAAAAVNYVGAGTVEFLLAEDRSFYFLEMNTRLQVEHPVTELIAGLDLVELQLKVASGEAIGLAQDDVNLDGHAIEIRLYAEDPQNDFLPSTGYVSTWIEPRGEGIRVDKGIESGDEVSPFYDPMIAKVIAYGADRDQARTRLVNALSASMIIGPETNRDFLIDALNRDGFASGEATTAFIEDEYGDAGFSTRPGQTDLCLAALVQFKTRNRESLNGSLGVNPELMNWSTAELLESVFIYDAEEEHTVVIHPGPGDSCFITIDDAEPIAATIRHFDAGSMTAVVSGTACSIRHASAGRTVTVATPGMQFSVTDVSGSSATGDAAGDGAVKAPMHGQLLEILVNEQDDVTRGQRLAILEAMKMQHEIIAEISGRISVIHSEAGTQIAMDALIMEIEPDEDSS